jgi:hypothetical protein
MYYCLYRWRNGLSAASADRITPLKASPNMPDLHEALCILCLFNEDLIFSYYMNNVDYYDARPIPVALRCKA